MGIHSSMITTAFDIKGYSIVENVGVVQGISVRSPGLIGSFVASIQSLWSGDVATLTTLCEKNQRGIARITKTDTGFLGYNTRRTNSDVCHI